MTIDPNTGDLLLGAELVGPRLQEMEFLKSVIGQSATLNRRVPAATWYLIWLPPESGREVGIVLGFARDGWMIQANIKSVGPKCVRQAPLAGPQRLKMK